MKDFSARWQANFFTGLAIVLPAVISVGILAWVFGTVSNLTDMLLVFLPRALTHKDAGAGPMYWSWSVVALILAALLIGGIGQFARNFIGRKLIELVDHTLLRVPLLNKVYGATKQLNEAFASGDKSSFKQVVLVEFPRDRQYSIGFLTGEHHPEAQFKTGETERLISVVIPATPNPTTAFLILVPESKVRRLEMSVADGIKYVISLGAIAPDFAPRHPAVVADSVQPAEAHRSQTAPN